MLCLLFPTLTVSVTVVEDKKNKQNKTEKVIKTPPSSGLIKKKKDNIFQQ